MKQIGSLLLMLVAIALYGCATQFTSQNIDALRIGMSSSDVREMFGSPGSVRSSVCGTATPKGGWVCETWSYESMSGTNKFTFSVKPDGKFLNDWNVHK